MYKIEVHNHINQNISLFFFIGLWNGDNRSKFTLWFSRIWYLTISVSYPVGLLTSSLLNANGIQFIFSLALSLMSFVIAARLYYFSLNQDKILAFGRTMGVLVVRDREEFNEVNTKIQQSMKFFSFFLSMIFCEFIMFTALSFFFAFKDRKLPLNVHLPVNWEESEIIFWFAFGLISYMIMMACVNATQGVIVWYILMSCGVNYQILVNAFRNMGALNRVETSLTRSTAAEDLFHKEFIGLIKHHQNLKETTNNVKECFTNLFFIQILTSGLILCGTVYVLAFISIDNPFEYTTYAISALYSTFDIFMVTYLGNEIKIWSSRLSYSLFECNWMDQSKLCKKSLIIVMETLKRPEVLVIGKIYQLDLEIFTSILNCAYSMFNVLKKFN